LAVSNARPCILYQLEFDNPLVPLVSVVSGLVVGELLGIEAALKRLGDYLEKQFSKGESPVSRAFVTTSLLFCVGPLTIIGSLEDGLRGDYDLLALKSALDFIATLTFASVLGWGRCSRPERCCSCRAP
jgi:uncharacterized protein